MQVPYTQGGITPDSNKIQMQIFLVSDTVHGSLVHPEWYLYKSSCSLMLHYCQPKKKYLIHSKH